MRLLKGVEFYRSWIINSIELAKGSITQDELNQIVVPSAVFLQEFDNIKGGRCSCVIKEIQQWYSYTASDLFNMIEFGEEAISAEVSKFLSDFRIEVGFNFFAEAGLLGKTVNRVLEKGEIVAEVDYYSLKELENDQSQSLISATQQAQVSDLLRKFESQNVREVRG